jgi:predicted RNA-binding Zn-ribbon protein involved in translation (DUF1610 family)
MKNKSYIWHKCPKCGKKIHPLSKNYVEHKCPKDDKKPLKILKLGKYDEDISPIVECNYCKKKMFIIDVIEDEIFIFRCNNCGTNVIDDGNNARWEYPKLLKRKNIKEKTAQPFYEDD